MAHNLMETQTGHAFVSAKEKAWHNLGVVVDHVMTSKEAIELASLDYEVGIEPLYTTINDEVVSISTHNATYNKRTNKLFGVVGQRYEVIQNVEAFDFLDEIVGTKLAMFETAGALGFGETIFVTVKLPNNIRLKSLPNEQIESYLLFTSSHDGSGSIRVGFTPVRVVCNNTLSAALSNLQMGFTIKHTKNARTRLTKIQELFKAIPNTIQMLGYKFDKLNERILTDIELNTILAKIVLNKDEYIVDNNGVARAIKELSSQKTNMIHSLKKSIYKGIGQDLLNPVSAYGVFNGATNYLQNIKGYKTEDEKFKTIYAKENVSNKMFNELIQLV